ncbi:hypothetical protein PR048_022475 [Dryococelus australis]|uniref:Uncharacterized protein n=1 Tax=Dryococelus australis TaxID=614101 RepID=A0ABQ9H153_9NEOP|nr:hypothetical protein PR048_022475 [Dryococelus australis]
MTYRFSGIGIRTANILELEFASLLFRILQLEHPTKWEQSHELATLLDNCIRAVTSHCRCVNSRRIKLFQASGWFVITRGVEEGRRELNMMVRSSYWEGTDVAYLHQKNCEVELDARQQGKSAVHLDGEPGSIPGGFAPAFSHVGIVPDDAIGRLVFLKDLPFPPPLRCNPAPYPHLFTLIASQDLDVKSRRNPSLTRRSNTVINGVR